MLTAYHGDEGSFVSLVGADLATEQPIGRRMALARALIDLTCRAAREHAATRSRPATDADRREGRDPHAEVASGVLAAAAVRKATRAGVDVEEVLDDLAVQAVWDAAGGRDLEAERALGSLLGPAADARSIVRTVGVLVDYAWTVLLEIDTAGGACIADWLHDSGLRVA